MTPQERERLDKEAEQREVYDLRVLVVGGGFQYIKMFYDAGIKGATSVEEADFICFTGGEDVSPNLYGERPIEGTCFNPGRDSREAGIYGTALGLKKPMVGICRGGQFLNVMNGGKCWQDVNNHGVRGGHSVIDMRSGEVKVNMTSTHHQQMRAAEDAEILAVAELSTHKESESEKITREKPEPDDMEVLWYSDSLSLCFQPHPEFAEGDCRNYFLELLDEYIMPAC